MEEVYILVETVMLIELLDQTFFVIPGQGAIIAVYEQNKAYAHMYNAFNRKWSGYSKRQIKTVSGYRIF